MKTRVLLLIALLAATAAGAARAEVVVVVAAESQIRSLTSEQIADVFLGRLSRLPSGAAAVPLDQAEGTAARNEFYLKLTGKSQAQIKAFWSKLIFTGRGRPPRAVPGNQDVLRALRDNPAAIGYVDRAFADSSVRIVRAEGL